MLDLPLERIHPQAFKAAQATHCATKKADGTVDIDRFWALHDELFKNQRALANLAPHAETIGISGDDLEAFKACLENDEFSDEVRQDMAEARKAGASGTPSFVLARTNPDDPTQVTGIAFLRGAQPFSAFQAQIDAALAAEE